MKSLKASILTEIKTAIHDAGLSRSEDAEEAVHSVRRRSKRIRAYLDLLPVSLSKQARRATSDIRRASASLSELRDSHVMNRTRSQILKRLNEIGLHLHPVIGLNSNLHHTAEQTSVSQETTQEQLKSAVLFLDMAKKCVSKMPRKQREVDLLLKLQKTYKEGRRITRRVADHFYVEEFHELRKVTKRFYHQCEFVVSAFECKLQTDIEQARALAEKLGNALDLSVLASNLSQPSQQENTPEVSAMIDESTTHMNILFSESSLQAYRLYFESPKTFARRFA